MHRYEIKEELFLYGEANQRYADLTLQEVRHRGARRIGGDRGDLEFMGFTLKKGKTFLSDPVVVTTLEGLSDEEALEIAWEILLGSFESIGLECVQH